MDKLVVFDLDNTLTKSKMVADPEMAQLISELLKVRKVAVISGGNFKQFKKDILDPLPKDANLSNLHLFPTDGTTYYNWDGDWKRVYIEAMDQEDKVKIRKAFEEALKEIDFHPSSLRGELIEDRESSMVFSALGQEADLLDKIKWDPDQKIRFRIKKILDKKIPEFEVNVAGTTSIDVTSKGLDKAYGIKKMLEYIKIPIENMVFIGDALFPGGNDNDVIRSGIKTIAVSGPEDTKKIIREIING